jgi:hypothetical protein
VHDHIIVGKEGHASLKVHGYRPFSEACAVKARRDPLRWFS